MIEPTTPIPDDFLPVQVVSGIFVVLVLGITVGLVRLGLPVTMSVPAFVVIAAILLIPFVPVIRRYHPEH